MSPNVFRVKDFITETKDDFNSPTTSTFSSNISHCKQMVNSIEESLDFDRNGLSKMKKAVKAIYNGGCANSENKIYLSESLEKLGVNSTSREKEDFLGAAFVKFSFIFKELSAREKSLMQNLHNIIMFPVDNVLKGDLKGVKNDLKKPVDKALKEYDIKISKIEKEKKAQAKEAGLIRTEISGAELAEEMDRERKQLQYQMCEYLIKVNEIEVKKSSDLLLHFIEYLNAQCQYFRGCLESIDQFQSYIGELTLQLQQARQRKEDERRELTDLRNLLKTSHNVFDTSSILNSSIGNEPGETQSNRRSIGYSLHQLQGNKQFGCFKSGYLLKKSESKMRVKVWQKRKCEVKDGFLFIWHSDEAKSPTKVNLLTCQIKTNLQSNQEDRSQSSMSVTQNQSSNNLKNCGSYFDLVSCNRTYHFQVEDERDAEAWISVLINSKESALKKEFDNSACGATSIKQDAPATIGANQSLRELQQNIIEQICKLPGNECCVDCGSTKDPTWLSTNFGVLTCIECSGIHREMGVHVSRIQSLTLDNIGTSQLLIARAMSNNGFNDIMEASCKLRMAKPKPTSSMDERNQFIRNKYIYKKYIIRTCTSESELLNDLEQAVLAKDLYFLLQVWAEGANLSWSLPSNALGDTALHTTIQYDYEGCSLHLVDFLVQNSPSLDTVTRSEGNTPLHYCVIYNRSECMKLLLRSNANQAIRNASGKTPLDLAKECQNVVLIELLELAEKNQKALFENVITDWSLQPEDPSTDFSDDDIDDKNYTPEEVNLRRANAVSSQNGNNRFRSSNRKFSFKYPTESESDSNDQTGSNIISSKLVNISNAKGSRPSSVIGDIQVVNIDTNNLSSYKSVPVSEGDQSNLVRGTNSNSTRGSGRNRLMLSTGAESVISAEPCKLAPSGHPRAFSAGHSRAASADISNYSARQFVINPGSSIQSGRLVDSKNGHHTRNNSVDNSLVTSTYQPLTINSSNATTVTTINQKPAIPAKPSGIVSVFVPGSNTVSHTPTNKSTGNIYGKVQDQASKPFHPPHPARTTVDGAYLKNQGVTNLETHPVPPPRKKLHDPVSSVAPMYRKCVALYDCEADQMDELSFRAGEVITVINEVTNDEEWMEGIIESDPSRRGLFPAIFVEFL